MNLPDKLKLNLTFEEMIREGMIPGVVVEYVRNLENELQEERKEVQELRDRVEGLKSLVDDLEDELYGHD